MAAVQGVASLLALLTTVTLLVRVLESIPTVCFGTNAQVLPPSADVVQLYQSNLIDGMRIYGPDAGTLHALRGTNIAVIVDAADVLSLASDDANASSSARAWVLTNVQPYPDVNIRYIAVGNEVTGNDTQKILPAMQKVKDALSAASLGHIKVSTAVRMSVVAGSPQPSGGAFGDPSVMGPIVKFLAANGSPLLANVYTYYAFKNDHNVDLSFALLEPSSSTKIDDDGHTYTNLLDAMVDSIYSAMEKEGVSTVPVVLSETGWPSDGGRGASKDNARIYNQNLVSHVGKGTPKRPVALEAYIFAMFDENLKEGEAIERHFGLFNPDKSPVYSMNFLATDPVSAGSTPQSSSAGWATRPVCYAMLIVGLSLVLLFSPVRGTGAK
uniref:Glucan endo-1,3-beta-D-glucosidase n=1 Tax=Oryza brachyantha TaxID=4533 RepID=J3LQN1_ORYBR